jgi:hypothetical protein
VFERQRRDGLAALAAAANAGETHDGADVGTPFGERRYFLRDVEIGFLDADGHGSGHEIIAMLVKMAYIFLSMIFSENRSPLFRIML